jgi:hypothetical protein
MIMLGSYIRKNDMLMRFLRPIKRSVNSLATVIFMALHIFFGSRDRRKLESISDYISPVPIAGYIGWIGNGNLGDEALFLAFKKLFPGVRFIDITDAIPIELRLHGLLMGKKIFDVVFLGGGTLINGAGYLPPLEKALSQGYPCIVFGTGVRNPQYWAELNSHDPMLRMTSWVNSLKRTNRVLVRGPDSKTHLDNYGLSDSCVIGDPALSICTPRLPREGKFKKVILNVGSKGVIWGEQALVNEEVGRFACYLLGSGMEVHFLAMNDSDAVNINLITEKFALDDKIKVWCDHANINATIEYIADSDVVIGQRLHAVVLACGSGVPAISLSYRPKCYDFMRSIGLEEYCVRTDEINFEALVKLMTKVEAQSKAISNKINISCDRLRKLQKQHADEIMIELI